jgi:predicted ArsR family transcriptional regulator
VPYPHDSGWKESTTSKDAAEAIAGHAKTVRARVLAFLTKRYPASFSADEIAADLGESILTVRPRVSELRRSELIEPGAERRVNRSGMRARCWRAMVRPKDATIERAQ